jgi:hypothetical protein
MLETSCDRAHRSGLCRRTPSKRAIPVTQTDRAGAPDPAGITGYAYPWDAIVDPDFPDRERSPEVGRDAIAAAYHRVRAATRPTGTATPNRPSNRHRSLARPLPLAERHVRQHESPVPARRHRHRLHHSEISED